MDPGSIFWCNRTFTDRRITAADDDDDDAAHCSTASSTVMILDGLIHSSNIFATAMSGEDDEAIVTSILYSALTQSIDP